MIFICRFIYSEISGFSTNSSFCFRRPTTTSDYRQLSSQELSSRGESESLSAGSHRHSLFSGSSANYRNVVGGDDLSDILLQGTVYFIVTSGTSIGLYTCVLSE